ncbi:MAG: HDIG domain-containing protein [Parachlamydiaceae bacterium]|nr:HDIG domain-containing protein [Parachlamydiaceae bacterium]
MPDRNNGLEKNQDLKFPGEQGFFDKSDTIRYLIIFAFAAGLFLFLHFREIRVDVLELNTIAPNYIVSQVEFDFPDDEATVILKQESVRDVGKIYKLTDKDIRHKRIEFENFLLYNQGWRGQAESGTFDQLYHGAELIERGLLVLRLTDPRTLHKMQDLGVSTVHYLAYTPNTLLEQITLPSFIWDYLKATYLPSSEYNSLSSALIIEFFKNSYWHIEEDIPAQRSLRKLVQSQVPEKMTHVPAGSRIIDQGERVTGRHIAMLHSMKESLGWQRNLLSPLTLLGSLIMTLILVTICMAYFRANQPRLLVSNRRLFLLVTILVLTMGIAKLTEFFLLSSKNNLIEIVRYPLFVPLAAILLCSLMNSGIATFASGFLSIVLSMTLVFDREGFQIINLVAALVAIFSTSSLRRRKDIFIVCLNAWLFCVAAIIALHLYSNTLWSISTLTDIIVSAFFMLTTAVLVVGVLPLLESGFKIMTDVSLMEYINPNNDLLRRLTIEAPGTYQHSVVVGNLAEAGALAIGANGLFCRVATLYHDIGKIGTSQYFTENQMEEMNIHQLLTPQESAQVIMSHVPEGVTLAREAGLPEPIIDIIKEHHGTTLVYYFYRKQIEKMGGDKSKVDEREFRYAGPKPRSKEAGIIMIADSFEAASRSLDKVNEETLTELIDRLTRDKIEDGQFNQCLLTIEDLCLVKKALVKTLLAAGHTRIKYPNQEKKTISIHQLEASA